MKGVNQICKQEIVDSCIKDYQNGLSKHKILKKYQCGQRSLNKVLKGANIKERNRSEVVQKYKLDENYFEKIDSCKKAYFLGFLWADGHNNLKNNCVSIGLTSKDVHILERFKKWLKSERPIKTAERESFGKKRLRSVLVISNKKISKDLLKLGMVQDKTRFPKWPTINKKFEKDFIRGFFDGDGCWYITKKPKKFYGSVSFGGNLRFLRKVSRVINKYVDINFSSKFMPKSSIYGIVEARRRGEMIKFGNWLYSNKQDAYLDRKYQKYLRTINFYSHADL